jgi:hypothetical protein
MDRRFWEMLFVCGWNPHWFDYRKQQSVDVWWTGHLDAAWRCNLMEASRELFDADAEFPAQERADVQDAGDSIDAEEEERRRKRALRRAREIGRPPLRSKPAAAPLRGSFFPPFTGRETSGLDAASEDLLLAKMLADPHF